MIFKLTPLSLFITVSILIKLLYVRSFILGHISFGGIINEISVLFFMILLVSLANHKFVSTLSLIMLDIFFSSLCLISIMYFDYFNTIFTYKSLHELDQVGTIMDGITAIFHIKYLLFLLDFFLLIFWSKVNPYLSWIKFNLSGMTSSAVLLGLVICIGSGIVNSVHTISEMNRFNRLGLLGYQIAEAATGLEHVLQSDNVINPADIRRKKGHLNQSGQKFKGIAKNKNVIVVQLESFQNFLINLRINGREVTPNLNKFVNDSLYFPHFFTQVGKGNTSDAEFTINTSIYPLGDTPMSTAIEGKNVPSFPKKLRDNGYYTATFHANGVNFWNRNELYRALGFNQYFDKKYFGTEDLISYGTSDEIMYKKTLEKVTTFRQNDTKFYTHIIALSSHFPFHLPDEKKQFAIKLPETFKDSIVGSYIESVSYADYAFGLFLQKLKDDGLYEDTLIAVYGDHQGLQTKTDHDALLVKNMLGREYNGILDHLNVPFIIKVPTISDGTVINTVGGLVDVYPTLANLLGLDIRNEVVFGSDLINSKNNLIGIRFYAPTGTYINQHYSFTLGKDEKSGTITDLENRNTQNANKKSLKQLRQILELLQLSDDYVRSLEKTE